MEKRAVRSCLDQETRDRHRYDDGDPNSVTRFGWERNRAGQKPNRLSHRGQLATIPCVVADDARIADVTRHATASVQSLPSTDLAAAPFLKWAGGKRQLLPQLRRFFPPTFETYIEPFLGSGAVFFDLHASGVLNGRVAVLSDGNADLVGCYCALRDEPDAIIAGLRMLEHEHRLRGSAFFYEVRDVRFNPARQRLLQANAIDPNSYGPELAAMLIYLNRTCFNGLFRLNARGQFNVPVGRYVNPRICDEANLRRVSTILNEPGVTLRHGTFQSACADASADAFVYFDPPYAPVSETAHFRSYTADGFSVADQEELQRVVIDLARRGCSVLLSNSVAPQITALYDRNQSAKRAGLRAHRAPARRAINCDGSARGNVEEYLISNLQPARD